MGAFTDASGNVIQPLAIGTGATLTVPAGATQLQLGVNGNTYLYNAGAFTATVSIQSAVPLSSQLLSESLDDIQIGAAAQIYFGLFQNGALLTDMDVFENVAFPVREHTDLPEALVRLLVLTKLQAVGLRGAFALSPGELSGGMARRVALARAIVMDPEVLIYDEPFVGLDPISLGVILRLIKQMNKVLGITSIIVSHDVRELASVADDSYLLSGGRIAATGTPAELRASDSPAVRQFMTGSAEGPVPFHYPAADYATQLFAADEP